MMRHSLAMVMAISLAVGAARAQATPGAKPAAFPDHGEPLREVPRGSTEVFVRTLDQVMPELMADYGTSAAVALVIDHGKVVASRAWGEAAPGVPVTADSVFGVASLSKLVTAWGFQTLVDRGRIDLDQPASKYLTAEQKAALPFDTDHLTPRQLLSHTAGLSGHSAGEYWPGDRLPSVMDELCARSANGAPNVRILRPPGSGWAYSGSGYGVLQIIAENISGKPFAAFLDEAVFQPLGMTRSFFGNPETTPGRVVRHLDESGQPVARLGYANLAAAGLYTTLADFTKLVMADLHDGGGVLRAGDVARMETAAPGAEGKYGLGYFVEKLTDNASVVGHDGSDVGWNSMYRLARSRDAGFVMFTNDSNGLGTYFPVMCGWYRSLDSDRTDYCAPTPQLVVHALYSQGLDAALALHARLAKAFPGYGFDRPYWNFVGYEMLKRHASAEAVLMFRMIAALHPDVADAFDSLGDGYRAAGDRPHAIASYTHALELDPGLASSKAALEALGAPAPAGKPGSRARDGR
jgi:CubicO group peptidase (beta-lactamase class C family)